MKGGWNVAVSVAYKRSARASVVTDIPTAGPFTAHTKSFGKLMKALTKCL